jgi:iron complex outermembrane receptor protein
MDRGVNVADQKQFSNTPKTVRRASMPSTAPLCVPSAASCARASAWQLPQQGLPDHRPQRGHRPARLHALECRHHLWPTRQATWSFSLQGSNLTDKAYRTDGYNIPALGVLNGFYGAPRQVSLGVSYRL